MTQLSIDIKNADIVRQGLQDLAAEVPKIGRLGIYRAMQSGVRTLKEYWTMNKPPALPSYTRKGTLAGGWWITPSANGYSTSNNTDYTKHVHGNAYGLEQAWMHQDRHVLLRDVIEDEVSKLPPEIENEISMVARRVGL